MRIIKKEKGKGQKLKTTIEGPIKGIIICYIPYDK